MESLTTESVRVAVRIMGEGGKDVHVSQLYEPLGLRDPDERRDLRKKFKDMLRCGEVTRVSDGVYRYNFEHMPRERTALARIWRYVRISKTGWTMGDAMMKTGVSKGHLCEYCNWLEKEGFIEQVGRKGTARLFRATARAERHPETPNPPLGLPDPFEKEKNAALKIVRVMLRGSLSSSRTAKEIAESARIILARFEKESVTENENEEEVC